MTTEDFLLAFFGRIWSKGPGEEGGEGEGEGGRGVSKSKGNLDNNEIKNNTDNL